VRRAHEWALVAVVALASGAAGYVYHAGRTAPESTTQASTAGLERLVSMRLPDLDQQPRSIDQWRGKVVVVNFWATWCAPCREEIPMFVRLQEEHRDRGLQFVGIALDQPDKVRPYAAELGMNFPVLIGSVDAIELTRTLGNRAGVLPYTVVIDRTGRIASIEVGAAKESKLRALLASLL
jgi:thiol-disulfide isomerase/thioredoxin